MINKLSSHLFYKVALLVLVFSVLQIVLIFYVVDHYYTDQDTIWDAHELYSYSSMVQNWNFPSDTLRIQRDIDNLHLSLSVYSMENKSLVWSHPTMVDPDGYIIFADSDYLSQRHDIVFPYQASFGENDYGDHLTRVDRGGLVYFFKLDKLDSGYSSEYINYVPPLVLLILFMLGLNYFIQYLLTPIKLMKQRIKSLRL